MALIKFFGLLSVDSELHQLIVNKKTIKEVIKEISDKTNLDQKRLEKSIMVFNGTFIEGSFRLKQQLDENDELIFMSPVCGG